MSFRKSIFSSIISSFCMLTTLCNQSDVNALKNLNQNINYLSNCISSQGVDSWLIKDSSLGQPKSWLTNF